MERNIAIVLAAGQGKRMNTSQKKQYLLLADKPVLYYSLEAFQSCHIITDIIIVVGAGEKEYVEKEYVEKYSFSKVRSIVSGGKERYDSVMNGLKSVSQIKNITFQNCYVWIHDGARPYIPQELLLKLHSIVVREKACIVGMPVKDTIKIVDSNKFVSSTPNRNYLWQVQTPQVFQYELITNAYAILEKEQNKTMITDDAMVVETFTHHKIKMVEGSYKNIKITTPEDLKIAEKICGNSVK